MSEQTIFRVASRHKPYSQLGNAMIRDNRLSFEARGVLAYILSHPSNWKFGLTWLCNSTDLGRDRARRIVKEHLALGYCKRTRTRNSDGTMGPYEYVFTDEPDAISEPQTENPSVDGTTDGKPVTGEPALADPTPTKKVRDTKIETKPPTPSPRGTDALEAFNLWNALALRLGLTQAARLTPDRRRRLEARLEDYGPDGWRKALANVERSKFLRGLEGDRKWRCTLDFLLSPSGFSKVHDGAYDTSAPAVRTGGRAIASVHDTSEPFHVYRDRMIAEGKLDPRGLPQ